MEDMEISYPRFGTLFNRMPDKLHYSPGVKVLAWGKNSRKRAVSGIPGI